MKIGLVDIDEKDLDALEILKLLKEFDEGDFKDLNEKVEAFIRGSNDAEYEFDEEEFMACLHELCDREYITGWYDENINFVVDDITPEGLELLEKMKKETEEIAVTKEMAVEEVVEAKEEALKEIAVAKEESKGGNNYSILSHNHFVFGSGSGLSVGKLIEMILSKF